MILRKKTPINHEIEPFKYEQAVSSIQYIQQKLISAAIQLQINYDAIKVKQLQKILELMKLEIPQAMTRQAFIYASSFIPLTPKSHNNKSLRSHEKKKPYQNNNFSIRKFKNIRNNELPVFDIISNNQSIKLDSLKIAMWIDDKIKNRKIVLGSGAISSVGLEEKPAKKYHSENKDSVLSMKSQKKIKNPELFPYINNAHIRPEDRFFEGMKNANKYFEQIREQRRENGIVQMDISEYGNRDLSGQDQSNYDPNLHDINKKISTLRQKAERSLTEIIQASAHNSHLRNQLLQALLKHGESRAQIIQKAGRYGAMKANRRMIEKRQKQLQKIQKLRTKLNISQKF